MSAAMPGWLTFDLFDLLQMMALGAGAGAAIAVALFVARDWQYQVHQWRYRNRIARGEDAYFEELRELEGYRPHAVTPQERAALPVQIMAFAGAGAVLGAMAHFPGSEPRHLFWILAALALARIVWIILTTPAPITGSPSEDDEPPQTRWQQIAPLLAELAAFGFLAFAFEPVADRIDASRLLAGTVFSGTGLLVCLALMAGGLWRLRESPPDDLDWSEQSRWQAVTYMLIASVPIIGIIFGAFALIG